MASEKENLMFVLNCYSKKIGKLKSFMYHQLTANQLAANDTGFCTQHYFRILYQKLITMTL